MLSPTPHPLSPAEAGFWLSWYQQRVAELGPLEPDYFAAHAAPEHTEGFIALTRRLALVRERLLAFGFHPATVPWPFSAQPAWLLPPGPGHAGTAAP